MLMKRKQNRTTTPTNYDFPMMAQKNRHFICPNFFFSIFGAAAAVVIDVDAMGVVEHV